MSIDWVRHRLDRRHHKPPQIASASAEPQMALIPQGGGKLAEPDLEFERRFLLALGWTAGAVLGIEREARVSGAGLIETAVASGAIDAAGFYTELAGALSFANGHGPYRIQLPSAPSEAWLLLDRPVPLAGEVPGTVALNGQ